MSTPSTHDLNASPSGTDPDPGPAGDMPDWLAMPVAHLVKRAPVVSPPQASIRDVAALMRHHGVSSVVLLEGSHLWGIVTDRDLRNRVVADGLDILQPVATVATRTPCTVPGRRPVFEALRLMAQHQIHHLPVMDGERLVGMVTATDLNDQHTSSAVYLVRDIQRQSDVPGLIKVSARVRGLQRHLVAANATAYSIGHMVTTITDALTTRLLQLAHAQLGPAPVGYVWVAAGSQARCEQTAKTDQDNCLVIDDRYDQAVHGAYFEALTRWVCDALHACGYVHCPGGMMAMTPEWRQPLQRWRRYFDQWIATPDPQALMLTCVFFDQRAVYGQPELLEALRSEVLTHTRGNSLFLAHMVGNALKHRPPLGLFGQVTTLRSGAQRGCIDLKHTGIAPIVELARIYALAGGDASVNTHERLEHAAQSLEVSEDGARDLRVALETLGRLRLAHQARQMARGETPDHFFRPSQWSTVERAQLKSALSVVQQVQNVLAQRYPNMG